jgi:HAD superfamily hydrolase (TIGR01509 family)
VHAAALRLGLEPPTRAEFLAVFGRLPFEECVLHWHSDVPLGRYAEAYDAQREAFPYEPIAGAADAVRRLAAEGLRVGVLTNGNRLKTQLKLQALGVPEEALDFVLHAENSWPPKPDPAAFLHALEASGAAPRATVYVTDNPLECEAAQSVGITPIGVLTGVWGRRDFEAAGLPRDRVCPSVAHVLPLILRPAGSISGR